MRLRARLALSFALLAVLPLAVVVPVALSNLRATLSKGLEARIQNGEAAALAAIAKNAQSVKAAVTELADSIALEEFVRDLQTEAPSTTPSRQALFADRQMKARGLSVLSVFDEQGTTLSSGHLHARLGDPDESLFAVTRSTSGEPLTARVELLGESGLRVSAALVYAHAVEYGSRRLWVVGGTLLDQPFAEHLSRLTGAAVEIVSPDASSVTAGLSEPPTVDRSIALPVNSQIHLRFSQASIVQAEAGLRRAFAALTGAGLLGAIVLGLLVASRITRPLEALTSAAREIAKGELDLKVEQQGSGEVAELVSAFNRMTSELKQTTARLIASEKVAAWQEVAKRLAHEIKNPLTPIKMSLETLLAAGATHDPKFASLFKESAAAMLEEVERLRRIVDEFSRFARLPKPQLSKLDLGELVEQVLALYHFGEGIEFQKEVLSGLCVQADRDQLTQVLLNLLKNAEDAVQNQGVVRLSVKPRGQEALIEVHDSGPGIDPNVKAHLFEPYFTTKEGGTGLGLAIASRICQEHSGRLEVESEPGKGTTFIVALPQCLTGVARRAALPSLT